MQCPHCGAENPEGATYCNLCQTSFVQRHGYDSAPGQVPAASEWSGPPAPPALEKGGSSGNKLLVWLIVLVAVAGLAVVGYALLHKGSTSAGTYRSTVSGLTFKYPVSWKEYTPSEFASQEAAWSGEASQMNESAIVDSPTAPCKNVIISQSGAGVDDSRWASGVRDSMLAKFQSDPDLAGEQVSAVTLKCGPAVAGSGTKTIAGQPARYRYVVVDHNMKSYIITYITLDPAVDIDSQWKTIEDSIGFTN